MDNETLQYILKYIDNKFNELLKYLGTTTTATTLPASSTNLGEIIVGNGLIIDENTGVLDVDQQLATQENLGFMSNLDKRVIDSLEEEADGNAIFNAIFNGYTLGGE